MINLLRESQLILRNSMSMIGMCVCILVLTQGSAQQITPSQNGEFLMTNATLVTVTNGNIEGDLLIKDGLIADIGDIALGANTKVINCTGKYIYPGFIDSGTSLGLSEVGSVSLTQDQNELGNFIPHMQALTAVNPSSVNIPVTRVNGVTTVMAVPQGGRFPGTAALINLHGYTPEQMYAGFKGVVMNYPSTGKRGRWDKRSDEDIKKAEEKSTKELSDIWDKAVAYARIDSIGKAGGMTRNDYNPQMDALLPVVRGKINVMINVNREKDILSAIKWIGEHNVNAILVGVSEGWRVAEKISEAGLSCIVGPVLSNPRRGSDKYDSAYRNASVLAKAGVKVALRTNEAENVRNLPFNAGFAATYGMGKEEALKAITINPAEIFGLGDLYGSLEKGKVANLFIADGDPFEMKTVISHLFINGWNVPIESRHTLLYDEFIHRNPGLSK